MTRLRLILAGILCALAAPALAHLLPAQTATMNIVGRDGYFVVSVPLTALHGIDDNRDGLASPEEIARHSREISAQFNRGFHVAADGAAATPLMTMAWSPQTDAETAASSSYIVVLHSVRFAAEPDQPAVSTDLFGTGPGEAQMTLTAKHDKRPDTAEVAILRPGASQHVFYRHWLSLLRDFVQVGIEHILTGPDHLLFLLTIVVAGAGLRYWLSVVTAFTIAHSITLSLAAFGAVRVSPALVEPAIAASIVVMAALNLWRGADGARVGMPVRLGIVFACGLLHGLGFASAIDAMAASGAHRLATLAGFNIGIELGQLAFLLAVLAAGMLARRLWQRSGTWNLPRLASITAGALAAVMLVGRVLPALPGVG